MYPNLFKQLDIPKIYNDLPKSIEVATQIEGKYQIFVVVIK